MQHDPYTRNSTKASKRKITYLSPIMPDNFPSVTYVIKDDQPIPFSKRSQDPLPLKPQLNPVYPIHQKGSNTYNLYTTIDAMKIGEHIEIKDRDIYDYVMYIANGYANRCKKLKPPVQLAFRGEWSRQEQLGRVWRRG